MERLEWVRNFTRAAEGTIAGNHQGMMFADSDVYKLMEAMAWEVGRSGSPDADARLRGLTEIIARRKSPTATSTPCSDGPARNRGTATSSGARALQLRPPPPGWRGAIADDG
jgi:hypothetical protein